MDAGKIRNRRASVATCNTHKQINTSLIIMAKACFNMYDAMSLTISDAHYNFCLQKCVRVRVFDHVRALCARSHCERLLCLFICVTFNIYMND